MSLTEALEKIELLRCRAIKECLTQKEETEISYLVRRELWNEENFAYISPCEGNAIFSPRREGAIDYRILVVINGLGEYQSLEDITVFEMALQPEPAAKELLKKREGERIAKNLVLTKIEDTIYDGIARAIKMPKIPILRHFYSYTSGRQRAEREITAVKNSYRRKKGWNAVEALEELFKEFAGAVSKTSKIRKT